MTSKETFLQYLDDNNISCTLLETMPSDMLPSPPAGTYCAIAIPFPDENKKFHIWCYDANEARITTVYRDLNAV